MHQELEADQRPGAAPTPLSLIHDIEVQLHRHIRHRLQAQFGDDGDAWWVEGVPLSIRQECVTRREADPDRDEPYAYTYLIDLKSILDRNWPLFEPDFLKVRKAISSKKELLDLLVHLNEACGHLSRIAGRSRTILTWHSVQARFWLSSATPDLDEVGLMRHRGGARLLLPAG